MDRFFLVSLFFPFLLLLEDGSDEDEDVAAADADADDDNGGMGKVPSKIAAANVATPPASDLPTMCIAGGSNGDTLLFCLSEESSSSSFLSSSSFVIAPM